MSGRLIQRTLMRAGREIIGVDLTIAEITDQQITVQLGVDDRDVKRSVIGGQGRVG